MTNERLKVPAAEANLLALGRAAYIFARLEWQAVWCLEKLSPGYVQIIGRKTAGQIATDFEKRVAALSDLNLKALLTLPAAEFKRLVVERNGILHGKPGTAPDGAQLLFRAGLPWTIPRLEDIADEFATCEQALNKLFYGVLGGP